MERKAKGNLRLYGGIGLVRRQCELCGEFSFVTRSGWSCECGSRADQNEDVEILSVKREGEGQAKRSHLTLPKALRRKLLSEQDGKCAYCSLPMWHWVFDTKRKIARQLKIHWDHVVPWEYSRTNKTDFVAACGICNGLKSDKIFQTMGEAMLYLDGIRGNRYEYLGETCPIAKGWNPVRSVYCD